MKKKVFFLLVGIFGFIAVPTLHSSSQTLSVKDAAALAKLAYDIGKDIDKNCQEKQKAGLVRVCKQKSCAPANCISFRTKCNDGVCS
jgi:hypothetical protein